MYTIGSFYQRSFFIAINIISLQFDYTKGDSNYLVFWGKCTQMCLLRSSKMYITFTTTLSVIIEYKRFLTTGSHRSLHTFTLCGMLYGIGYIRITCNKQTFEVLNRRLSLHHNKNVSHWLKLTINYFTMHDYYYCLWQPTYLVKSIIVSDILLWECVWYSIHKLLEYTK